MSFFPEGNLEVLFCLLFSMAKVEGLVDEGLGFAHRLASYCFKVVGNPNGDPDLLKTSH